MSEGIELLKKKLKSRRERKLKSKQAMQFKICQAVTKAPEIEKPPVE